MTDVRQSPEFRLVAACCRPAACPDRQATIAAAARDGFDPACLVALARAHRVEGFVADGLRLAGVALDTPHDAILAERAAASRQQMLRNAGEEIRVAQQFRARGIEPLFVKGATLAMLAHRSLALKTSWDIDMLVTPDDTVAARAILTDAGYILDLPGIDASHLVDRFFARNKETTWINAERRTALELHTALVDPPVMLAGVDARSPRQSVEIARGAPVMTLAAEELFAYLCVHGTTHRWERLKWLVDVAALVTRDLSAMDRLYPAAVRFGAANSAATALVLCRDLFDIDLPHALRTDIGRNRTAGVLARRSILTMGSVEAVDPASLRGLVRWFDFQFSKWLQVSGFRARSRVAASWLDMSYNPARLAIPTRYLRLHALMWFPLHIARRLLDRRQPSPGKTASKP